MENKKQKAKKKKVIKKKDKKIRLLIGSINPVKTRAVEKAFKLYFKNIEVLSFKVDSGVSDQPLNQETFEGSKNRVFRLMEINKKNKLKADYFVSIEGGLINLFDHWFNFSVVCIANKKEFHYSTTGLNELPYFVVKKMLNNIELGKIMDSLSRSKNSKQKNGAIGFLTDNRITRTDSYVYAVILALIPFIKKDLFKK